MKIIIKVIQIVNQEKKHANMSNKFIEIFLHTIIIKNFK